MKRLELLLGIMRVPFLILTPACVVVGIGTAYQQSGLINGSETLLVLLGALSAHISVNTFNEYFDYKNGLDSKTQRTPFSGGSGTLPAHPEMERTALLLACAAWGITSAVGVYFLRTKGWHLLPFGILGLCLLVTYTIWWMRHPVLSLIAPGLGFGIIMVMGTHYALTGTHHWSSFMASLVPTFLVSNLLLINQFPDIQADRSAGRRHFPIVIGPKASGVLYGALLFMAYLSVILGVLLELLPVFSLLSLLTVILAWRAYQGVIQNAENIGALIPSMGLNVMIVLLTPVLLAVGLFLG